MKKIIIVGPSGSGKSYLSKEMAKILGYPLFHLDNIWWNEDKSHISREEFDAKLNEILALDKWIIDGDYSRTYEVRMEACDTIIFLDFPLEVCLKGVESRIGKDREDIPWKEEEFDPEFKEWIINWYTRTKPHLEELLDKYRQTKEVIVFHTRDEVEVFLH